MAGGWGRLGGEGGALGILRTSKVPPVRDAAGSEANGLTKLLGMSRERARREDSRIERVGRTQYLLGWQVS